MRYTHFINGWESFAEVAQDAPGVVATTGGGLFTKNLMNCMCLILTDESGQYGMLHVSPNHENTAAWVTSLVTQVGATVAIVTGGNGSTQPQQRLDELVVLLDGLTVIDETKGAWVPDSLHPVKGLNRRQVGYVAVNASNGDYALSGMPFADSVAPVATATRARRNSADGNCVVM
jgi:hypothetical protein